ncbi:MAG TPA: Imm1 family immunity protein [Actinocatenispora sp.]
MRRLLAYHGLRVTVDGESAEFADDLARLGTMMTDGVLRLLPLAEIGPDADAPGPPDLLFGIDRAAGRGVLQWCSSGEFAVDPLAQVDDGRLLFDGRDLGRGVLAYEAWQTRVPPATVRAEVIDYVRTGSRPGGVCWVRADAAPVSPRR